MCASIPTILLVQYSTNLYIAAVAACGEATMGCGQVLRGWDLVSKWPYAFPPDHSRWCHFQYILSQNCA